MGYAFSFTCRRLAKLSGMTSSLIMADLDGTLVDRDAAFSRSVARFCEHHGLGSEVVPWVMDLDEGGYAPRDRVAYAICVRFPELRPSDCWSLLDDGGCEDVELADDVAAALDSLRADGCRIVVVTNGPTSMQERKMFRIGLDRFVDGWVVSGTEGVKKPEPEIFRIAAKRVGSTLDGAWMIGDNPEADIRGAHVLGCRSSWISRGRTWPHEDFAPTRVDTDVASALLGVRAM